MEKVRSHYDLTLYFAKKYFHFLLRYHRADVLALANSIEFIIQRSFAP